jgi:hypothetical protein
MKYIDITDQSILVIDGVQYGITSPALFSGRR